MIRYVVTAIKTDGYRKLAFDNNYLNTYATKQEADDKLAAVIENNHPDVIKELIGTDLKVLPKDCWSSGDAKGIYVDE